MTLGQSLLTTERETAGMRATMHQSWPWSHFIKLNIYQDTVTSEHLSDPRQTNI